MFDDPQANEPMTQDEGGSEENTDEGSMDDAA